MSDEPSAPVAGAPRPARRELPRRFYEAAAITPVGDGFGLTLDGKQAKTPGRNPLVVAERAVAQALAAEWGRQGERIDPATMPLTRIVHSAIDRVAGEMEPVKAEIVKYAGSDLVCYRGEGPESLVAAQEAAWGPVLAWAREALGARFVLAEGIIAVEQPAESLKAVSSALADARPVASWPPSMSITALTGSALIALAVSHGAFCRGRGVGGRPCRRGLADGAVGQGRGGSFPPRRPLAGDAGGGADPQGRWQMSRSRIVDQVQSR